MTLPEILAEVRAYPAGVAEETRKIDWPTWANTKRMTSVVMAVVAVSTVIIGVMDLAFSTLMTQIMR